MDRILSKIDVPYPMVHNNTLQSEISQVNKTGHRLYLSGDLFNVVGNEKEKK